MEATRLSSWHGGCFLHFDGIKEFERATMTRIGRCQIKPHNLLAMLPPGETISPRSKFLDQTASTKTSVPTSLGCLVVPYRRLIHKLFF
jgi:hypothetical protein